MIITTMRIQVNSENRKELLQTVSSLIEKIRRERGCLSHHIYQDIMDENAFIVVEEWASQVELDDYLRSDRFGILLGALNLLGEPPDIRFNAISYTAGLEAVEAARG